MERNASIRALGVGGEDDPGPSPLLLPLVLLLLLLAAVKLLLCMRGRDRLPSRRSWARRREASRAAEYSSRHLGGC